MPLPLVLYGPERVTVRIRPKSRAHATVAWFLHGVKNVPAEVHGRFTWRLNRLGPIGEVGAGTFRSPQPSGDADSP